MATAAEQILAAVARTQSNRPAGEAEKIAPVRTVAAPVASPRKRHLVWIGAVVTSSNVAFLRALIGVAGPTSFPECSRDSVKFFLGDMEQLCLVSARQTVDNRNPFASIERPGDELAGNIAAQYPAERVGPCCT